ncbi:MAG: hypothetical protein SFX18_13450 [Pirellulales bacterium]|nr:hypothetical protein [Pirellulales bacterium]
MSDIAAQLLATFDMLEPQEQHDILANLLRRGGELPDTVLTEEQLTGIAEELFLALDAEESDADNSLKR